MAATFDPTLPTDLDRLRFALGDTNVTAPLLEDETYAAMLDATTDWREAGINLAAALIARFAQQPDSISISGEFSISWRERIGAWTAAQTAWKAAIAVEGGGITSLAPSRDIPVDQEYSGRYEVDGWRVIRYG